MDRLRLAIADIGLELTWNGAGPAQEPTLPFYQPFMTNIKGRPDIQLEVHCGPLLDVTVSEQVFDATPNHWRLFRANGHDVFEVFDTVPPHPTVQLAVMSPDFRQGEVFRRPEKDVPEIPAPSWSLMRLMRPFGELLLITLLSHGRGVLLHALGVAVQGEGLLFIGRSGAGKTTLANLYKPHQSNGGVTILGDERVVVTKEEGRFWLSGTPWPGEAFTVSADSVPLRKIFFLEHGTRNALIADRHQALFCLLFQQLFLPFWNSAALGFAMDFSHELLSSVPAHRLTFVNDARVIEFLRRQSDE